MKHGMLADSSTKRTCCWTFVSGPSNTAMETKFEALGNSFLAATFAVVVLDSETVSCAFGCLSVGWPPQPWRTTIRATIIAKVVHGPVRFHFIFIQTLIG